MRRICLCLILSGGALALPVNAADVLPTHIVGTWGTGASLYGGTDKQAEIYLLAENAEQWEFAVHEVHNEKCGGAPGVSPVRDRYEVDSAGKVKVYNAAEGEFKKF